MEQTHEYVSGDVKPLIPGQIQVRRFNPGQLVTYAVALGTAALILSFYVAIIVRFLRWAL